MIDQSKPDVDYVPAAGEIRGWLGTWKNPNGFVQAEGFDRWLAEHDLQLQLATVDLALGAIAQGAPPINAELSMRDGAGPFEDRGMAAYIEGYHDAHSSVSHLRSVIDGTYE